MVIIKQLKALNCNVWNIAFCEFNVDIVNPDKKCTWHYLKHNYKNRWFADPFILEVTDDEILVLVEEMEYERNVGRIAQLNVDRQSYELKDMTIIFELPTHLSFPFIFRKENNIYILPENSSSGCSFIYDYVDEKFQHKYKVCNSPLTDATIANIGNSTYLLSTEVPNSNKNVLDIRMFNVENFSASKIIQKIEFNNNIARNAGEIFLINKKIYRPAQDCNDRYGRGVVIQELTVDSHGGFHFEEVKRMYSSSFRYNLGLHTLNNYKGVGVKDERGLLHPIIGRIVRLMLKILGH